MMFDLKVMQAGKYILFYEYLIGKLFIKWKFILSTSVTWNKLTSPANDVTKASYKSAACDGNHGDLTRKFAAQFYIFKRMKLGDSPITVHHELESLYGTSFSYD